MLPRMVAHCKVFSVALKLKLSPRQLQAVNSNINDFSRKMLSELFLEVLARPHTEPWFSDRGHTDERP